MSSDSENALDLPAYLARIGYKGELAPTLPVLLALHEAHVTSVPFENLDVYLGKGIRIDLGSIQAKIVKARRGGYCFEQNTLFAAVLEAVGFKVAHLSARVRMGTSRVLPRTHMVLRVEIDGTLWHVDVGFGWSGLIQPIPLQAGKIFRQGVWQYRFKNEGSQWVMESVVRGSWQDQYLLCEEPQLSADYEMANYMTSTHPASRFVLTVTAQRCTPSARHIVKNREYIIDRGGESTRLQGRREYLPPGSRDITVEKLADDAALLEVLEEEFGIVLPEGASFPKLQ